MSFLTKKNGSGKARHGGKVWQDREELLQALALKDGAVVSFHHHLRNGDGVMNLILQGLQKQGVKGLTLMASSIFPVHGALRPLLQDGTITNIITSYISGPLGEAVSRGELQGQILMQSHGGRARSILSGEIVVDAAFIAAPSADPMGNISGVNGKNACGALGYAMADAQKAKTVIAVTDEVVPYPNFPADITQDLVDGILVVESIGEKAGIVSGTTKVTKDPIGLKIAKDTLEVMEATGLLKEGFSYQSGAGGISLAVTSSLRDYMREKGLVGSFASGGITGHLTQMLEEGLFRALYDVQCFDLQAIDSLKKNPAHLRMSASQYGNPSVSSVVEKLDLVILGATEIDVDFNVNVTTGADGVLMGGSGGHQDTASGSQVSIIVSKLLSSRLPFIRERVDCITTPGSVVDVLVTERGIAVNPSRQDLLEKLTAAGLPVKSIHALKQEAEALMGIPKAIQKTGRVIGHSQSRTGEILDEIYQVEN